MEKIELLKGDFVGKDELNRIIEEDKITDIHNNKGVQIALFIREKVSHLDHPDKNSYIRNFNTNGYNSDFQQLILEQKPTIEETKIAIKLLVSYFSIASSYFNELILARNIEEKYQTPGSNNYHKLIEKRTNQIFREYENIFNHSDFENTSENIVSKTDSISYRETIEPIEVDTDIIENESLIDKKISQKSSSYLDTILNKEPQNNPSELGKLLKEKIKTIKLNDTKNNFGGGYQP